MNLNQLAGSGSLPLALTLPATYSDWALVAVGIAALYWAFTCGANDKLIAKTNRELGKAEGYLECIADNYRLMPKSVPSDKGKVRS